MSVRTVWIPAAMLACVLAGGCASEGPAPREQMERARTLVGEADKVNAQRYAAADVQRAHEELNNAERNYGAKKYDEAKDRWQARVNKDWRFYFTIVDDSYRILKLIPHPKK